MCQYGAFADPPFAFVASYGASAGVSYTCIGSTLSVCHNGAEACTAMVFSSRPASFKPSVPSLCYHAASSGILRTFTSINGAFLSHNIALQALRVSFPSLGRCLVVAPAVYELSCCICMCRRASC